MKILGVDIGGTKTAVILGTDKPEVLKKEAFATLAPYDTLDKIIEIANSYRSQNEDFQAIGISCGGPLNSREGLILSPPNLPTWDKIPVCTYLSDALGVRAYLQNDANACAWAEFLWGAGVGCRHMAFLTFGTGLGAGLILDGRLYTGASDMAGELGHIRLSRSGPVGFGKEGSFEGFCSGGGLARLAEIQMKSNPTKAKSFIEFLGNRSLSAYELSVAAKKGDTFALSIFEESGRRLGQGLSILLDILNLEKVVIGSMYVRMREYFQSAMEEVLKQESLSYCLEACDIVPAILGESLGDFAALSVGITKGEANA